MGNASCKMGDATSLEATGTTTSFAHAYGAFLGVLCGDAAGATLEFFDREITSELAQQAMRMPGGGNFDVGPGQITDDSELALALARGLVGHAPSSGFPMLSVAKNYREWCCVHRPFDIGNTCRSAFRIQDSEDLAVEIVAQSARYNAESEANGSLMRIISVAIWASSQPADRLVEYARQEATLSHPNPVCQDCNAVYCLLVAHLIQHPGDRLGALARAEEFVRAQVETTKVRDWFLTESLDISSFDCSRMIGHVRWAFVLAIYHLRHNTSYEAAIHDTLMRGGDTDTNAAIVGGLLGALHGVEAIPAYMRKPVLAFDCANPGSGRKRPETYRSSQLEELTRKLLQSTEG